MRSSWPSGTSLTWTSIPTRCSKAWAGPLPSSIVSAFSTTGKSAVISNWVAKSRAWAAGTSNASRTTFGKAREITAWNIERRTSNIELPTSNFQLPTSNALAVRLVQFHFGRGLFRSQATVQTLHPRGERHREVHVPFRDFFVKTFGHQGTADEHQETQRQHLERRMLVNEIADAPRENQHEHQCDDDRRNHDPELPRHADRRDDRVERKHDVEQENLDHYPHKIRRQTAGDRAVFAFEFFMNLARAFPEQEQSPEDENQVPARHRMRLLQQH